MAGEAWMTRKSWSKTDKRPAEGGEGGAHPLPDGACVDLSLAVAVHRAANRRPFLFDRLNGLLGLFTRLSAAKRDSTPAAGVLAPRFVDTIVSAEYMFFVSPSLAEHSTTVC